MPAPPGHTPRHVHVLYVHGVGAQSKLSSLLKPYQAIRSNASPAELPLNAMDRAPGWNLRAFDDHLHPSRLELVPDEEINHPRPNKVFFYEVNYSDLMHVVRQNHPIELTHLFIGFNMAVEMAESRLAGAATANPDLSSEVSVAKQAARFSRTMLAVTLPLLGILPWAARRFQLQRHLEAFSRFFEDVATFAMDKTGYELVAKHIDATLSNIRGQTIDIYDANADHVVLVAHSLGSVVAHNYLVRNWAAAPGAPPKVNTLLTYGSPIGLLCWLWLFIEHEAMSFAEWRWNTFYNAAGELRNLVFPFFVWPHADVPTHLAPIRWINVLHTLDPIATRFPMGFCFMGLSRPRVKAGLISGEVTHVVQSHGMIPAVPHTQYYENRPSTRISLAAAASGPTFIEILLSATGLSNTLVASTHPSMARAAWSDGAWKLWTWEWVLRAIGILIAAYGLTWRSGFSFEGILNHAPILFLLAASNSAVLSGIQKFVWGAETARINRETLNANLSAYSPYRIRMLWGWFSPGAPHYLFGLFATVLAAAIWYFAPQVASTIVLGNEMPHLNLRVVSRTIALGAIYSTIFAAADLIAVWRLALRTLGLTKPWWRPFAVVFRRWWRSRG